MCPSILAGYGVVVNTAARFAHGVVYLPWLRHRCTIRCTIIVSISVINIISVVRCIAAAVAADAAVAVMFIFLPKSISEIFGCFVEGLQGIGSYDIPVAFAINKISKQIFYVLCFIALRRSEKRFLCGC